MPVYDLGATLYNYRSREGFKEEKFIKTRGRGVVVLEMFDQQRTIDQKFEALCITERLQVGRGILQV